MKNYAVCERTLSLAVVCKQKYLIENMNYISTLYLHAKVHYNFI